MNFYNLSSPANAETSLVQSYSWQHTSFPGTYGELRSEPSTMKKGLLYQFLYRLDGSLTFIFLSPNCYEFFQVGSECLDCESHGFDDLLHPDDHSSFYQSIAEAAKNLLPWQWMGRYILPSGEIKCLRWEAKPSLQTNGNIFWHGSLVDLLD